MPMEARGGAPGPQEQVAMMHIGAGNRTQVTCVLSIAKSSLQILSVSCGGLSDAGLKEKG